MLKYIVDSSIWIDFFSDHLPITSICNLNNALEVRQVVITDIILHELLVGTKSHKEYKALEILLSPIDKLRIPEEQLQTFNEFGWDLARKGLLGKYTDLTIAFLSQANDYPVISLDHYFATLAQHKIIKTINW